MGKNPRKAHGGGLLIMYGMDRHWSTCKYKLLEEVCIYKCFSVSIVINVRRIIPIYICLMMTKHRRHEELRAVAVQNTWHSVL